MNAPFRIEGNRLNGYMIVNTQSGRQYGKKSGYGRPYKVYGAARRRLAELVAEYEPVRTAAPRQTPPVNSWKRDTVIPKPSVLPDELFDFE